MKLEFSKYYDYFLNYAYYESMYPGEPLPFPGDTGMNAQRFQAVKIADPKMMVAKSYTREELMGMDVKKQKPFGLRVLDFLFGPAGNTPEV